MNRLLKQIESIMQGHGKTPVFSMAPLLGVGAFLYKIGIKTRSICYQKGILPTRRLPCRVVSIGNITLGGTGKTPMSIFVASAFKEMGLKTAILSRGYRGTAERTGGIVSDGKTVRMDPEQAGDEPFMIASRLKGVPVLVGGDRFRMGQIAVEKFSTDVIVLDDGFQHVALARDLDILLLDDRYPFGNQHLVPRGTLREPVSALERSHGFVLTRCVSPEPVSIDRIRSIAGNRPVFTSTHRPRIQKIIGAEKTIDASGLESANSSLSGFLKNRTVFAFSGIGGNKDFFQTVESFKCRLSDFQGFPDHHRYSRDDLKRVQKKAFDSGAELLVTTEKDYAKIMTQHGSVLTMDLAVIGIDTVFGEEKTVFYKFLENRIRKSDSRHIAGETGNRF
jgi:tetraacyldisaccharide 4'-kinase